jgi:hypothetical protein
MTPGSPEAVAAGCTCPILDNNRGLGHTYHREPQDTDLIRFWVAGKCPMHAPKPTLYSSTTIECTGTHQKEEKGYS